MAEIRDRVTYKGKPITLVGEGRVEIGDLVPDVVLAKSMDEDLHLSELRGKVVVLNVIPSVDTPVCSRQTATFEREANQLGDNVRIVSVSMDLPFAIKRWCELQGIKIVITTSDYKYHDLGKKFSLMMRGLGLLARSVFVIDKDGRLAYEEIVPRMEDEPDYGAALLAVRSTSGSKPKA
jgi:thiol peroxidase